MKIKVYDIFKVYLAEVFKEQAWKKGIELEGVKSLENIGMQEYLIVNSSPLIDQKYTRGLQNYLRNNPETKVLMITSQGFSAEKIEKIFNKKMETTSVFNFMGMLPKFLKNDNSN